MREDVHGLAGRLAHGANLIRGREARRVQRVGTRAFIRLKARDRVGEVGIPVDVVLRARGHDERKAEAPRCLARRGNALDRVFEVVDHATRVVVLDRAADGARLGDAQDRVGRVRRGGPYPFSRSTDTGSGVASSSALRVRDHLVEGGPPSGRPRVNAKPELVLASAWNPSPASTLADPASQGFGMMNALPRAAP